jgi:hypothetical protein
VDVSIGVKKLLNLAFDECRRFAFGARKSLGLDFPGRIHGEHAFLGSHYLWNQNVR